MYSLVGSKNHMIKAPLDFSLHFGHSIFFLLNGNPIATNGRKGNLE